jgi:hypothetical protein
VQRVLGVVRFLDRVDLRAQVVRAQEVVRDAKPSGPIPLEEMEAAIPPEVRQG